MKKTILLFGLVWVSLYCLFGFYLGSIYSSIMQSLQVASNQGDLVRFWAVLADWNAILSSHVHGLGFGMLAMLIAIVWDEIKLPNKGKNCIGIILLSGIIINSVFNYFIKIVPFLVLGDLFILVAVLLSLLGVFRNWKDSKE